MDPSDRDEIGTNHAMGNRNDRENLVIKEVMTYNAAV